MPFAILVFKHIKPDEEGAKLNSNYYLKGQKSFLSSSLSRSENLLNSSSPPAPKATTTKCSYVCVFGNNTPVLNEHLCVCVLNFIYVFVVVVVVVLLAFLEFY